MCARARGLPDYTPVDCGFLVEPGDHAALADRLALLLKDEPLRLKMGQTANEFVKKLAPEKIAEQWEKIYADAIANKTAKRS